MTIESMQIWILCCPTKNPEICSVPLKSVNDSVNKRSGEAMQKAGVGERGLTRHSDSLY